MKIISRILVYLIDIIQHWHCEKLKQPLPENTVTRIQLELMSLNRAKLSLFEICSHKLIKR